MHGLRAYFGTRRRLAMVVVLMALCLKAFVPAGYMVSSGEKIIAIEICADTQGEKLTRQVAVPTTGSHPIESKDDAGKAHGACAFSSLAFAALGGADGLLLAAALSFIVLSGLLPATTPRARAIRFQRPPLRGPPLPT